MEIHRLMLVAVDFERWRVPLDSTSENDFRNAICTQSLYEDLMEKLSVNQPITLGYNIIKNPSYDNLILEIEVYIKHFDENCVEWLVNEILAIETYRKNCF